jgi:hypothetical protein
MNRTANQPTKVNVTIANNDNLFDDSLVSPFLFEPNVLPFDLDDKNNIVFDFEPGWNFLDSTGTDGFPNSSPTITTPQLSEDSYLGAADRSTLPQHSGSLDAGFTWSPTTQQDLKSPHGAMSLSRSRSMGDVPQLGSSHELWYQVPNTYTLPTSNQANDYAQSQPMLGNQRLPLTKHTVPTCNCFVTCLQSLQALNNQSGVQLETTIDTNRKAIESCASMLGCNKCTSQPDATTITMLLATVIDKIAALYQVCLNNSFDNGAASDMWQEMQRLEQLVQRYHQLCARVTSLGGTGIQAALMGHLGQNVGFTFELLKIQTRSGDQFS